MSPLGYLLIICISVILLKIKENIMPRTSTALTAWRKWLMNALISISHQVYVNEKKLNKILELIHKNTGGDIDKELIGLTEKLKHSSEDLQTALDEQGPKPKKQTKGKSNGKSHSGPTNHTGN